MRRQQEKASKDTEEKGVGMRKQRLAARAELAHKMEVEEGEGAAEAEVEMEIERATTATKTAGDAMEIDEATVTTDDAMDIADATAATDLHGNGARQREAGRANATEARPARRRAKNPNRKRGGVRPEKSARRQG